MARYAELFLDPYAPGVENPLWRALAEAPATAASTVADLGCGTGELLPHLAERFGQVIALDFAPAMIERARSRLEPEVSSRVTFLTRPMHELDDLVGRLDVAVAVNSLVMPDVRLIDRSLRSIRESLTSDGLFLGILPSIDAISYHLSLLTDRLLDQGYEPRDAERLAGSPGRKTQLRFRVRSVSLPRFAAEILAAVRGRIPTKQGWVQRYIDRESALSLGREPGRRPRTRRSPAELGLVLSRPSMRNALICARGHPPLR